MKIARITVFETFAYGLDYNGLELNHKFREWRVTPSALFLEKHQTTPFRISTLYDPCSISTKYTVYTDIEERDLLIWKLTY